MSTYKKEAGTAVQNNAGDYTGAVEGQLWYNSTAGSFQFRSVSTAGAWATGTSMPAVIRLSGYAGTPTAAFVFGGSDGGPRQNLTYEYNGTSWSSGGNMIVSKNYLTGCGTLDATLAFGGEAGATGCYGTTYGSCTTELYNGTSWTAGTNAPFDGSATSMAGTQTAAITAGDSRAPASPLNGFLYTSGVWTSAPSMNTATPGGYRSQTGILGNSQSSAIFAGGNNATGAPTTAAVEEWNGSTWTEIADINTSRGDLGGAGSVTSGLVFGGKTPPATYYGSTETWNGSTWTEEGDLSTTRGNASGNRGTSSATWAAGGEPVTSAFEEWTGAGAPVTETITTS